MANGWTPERRARQAQLIRQWQPWRQSTGPRSDAGKQRSAANAVRLGLHTRAAKTQRRDLGALLADCRKYLVCFSA